VGAAGINRAGDVTVTNPVRGSAGKGGGGVLSCAVALGEMNSKTKKDELGDAYIYIYLYAPCISPTQLNSLLGLQVVAMAFR